MRHRYAYATFPRAYSKSFLSVLVLMLRCVLFPGAKLFVTTGGKEQAAGIAREKVDELCKLIPGLRNEIDWTRGASKASKDMVEYKFTVKENIARCKKMGVPNLPSIYINGKLKFRSLVPSKEELEAAIREVM